jgi:hypothetical protein
MLEEQRALMMSSVDDHNAAATALASAHADISRLTHGTRVVCCLSASITPLITCRAESCAAAQCYECERHVSLVIADDSYHN